MCMYDIYDVLLWSIPTVLMFGVFADRLVETVHQIPLLISGIIALCLIFYALFVVGVSD